jgi:hypothetical protein
LRRLRQRDQAQERVDHHREVLDAAVGVGAQQVEALDVALADAGAEDQGMERYAACGACRSMIAPVSEPAGSVP